MNAKGPGEWSPTLELCTDAALPAPVAGVACTAGTHTTLTSRRATSWERSGGCWSSVIP